jgi:hypothetical protein
MRKLLLLLLAPLAIMLFQDPTEAKADIGGTFPCPGLPSYPFVGQCGLVGVVPYYFSDGPVEANGSHWHCEAGGVSIGGGAFTATSGLGLGGLGTFGFAFGSCYYKWPDGALAPMPNPPGAWKQFLVPAPIPAEHATGAPYPYDQTQDVAPPPVPADQVPLQDTPPPVVAPPTMTAPIHPGDPENLAPEPDKVGPPVAPGSGTVPTVTNPDNPNPDATPHKVE